MSIISAGVTTTTSLVQTGNIDGTLQLQVNGTTPSVTLATTGAVGVGAVPSFGTAGQVLTSQGSGAAPTWTTVGGGSAATPTVLGTVFGSTSSSSTNTSVGYYALVANTTGGFNVAVGMYALDANTTGARNTALGDNALGAVTTGDNNLGAGRSAGLALTTGVNNTFVGAYNGSTGGSGELITTGSNNTILGAYNGNQGGLDIRTASNYIVLSDGGGNVEFTAKDGSSWALPGALVQTGTGITFPATQSASSNANTLDDYEEGTFTISAIPSTSGSITLYAGSNPASYTKIGRMVTVSGFVYVQSVSSPVGVLRITGLPFAIRNQDPSGRGAGSVAGIGLASGATTSLQLRFAMNETELRIEKFAAGTFSNLTGDVQTGTELYFSATYPTAT